MIVKRQNHNVVSLPNRTSLAKSTNDRQDDNSQSQQLEIATFSHLYVHYTTHSITLPIRRISPYRMEKMGEPRMRGVVECTEIRRSRSTRYHHIVNYDTVCTLSDVHCKHRVTER